MTQPAGAKFPDEDRRVGVKSPDEDGRSILPLVYIFDNEDLRTPYRKVAVFENGKALHLTTPVPKWLVPLLQI